MAVEKQNLNELTSESQLKCESQVARVQVDNSSRQNKRDALPTHSFHQRAARFASIFSHRQLLEFEMVLLNLFFEVLSHPLRCVILIENLIGPSLSL